VLVGWLGLVSEESCIFKPRPGQPFDVSTVLSCSSGHRNSVPEKNVGTVLVLHTFEVLPTPSDTPKTFRHLSPKTLPTTRRAWIFDTKRDCSECHMKQRAEER
jgi:hypothetical protein